MFCTNCGNENEDGARFCTGCGEVMGESGLRSDGSEPRTESGGTDERAGNDREQMLGVSTSERRELLAGVVNTQVASGYRIESQVDFLVVLVRGNRVNHVLHLLITLFTCGLWGLVWLILVVAGGEKRLKVSVDEWGNINSSRV